MGQDNNLTWGNIIGTMITISYTDLMADQKWNVINDFEMIYDNDNVKATN